MKKSFVVSSKVITSYGLLSRQILPLVKERSRLDVRMYLFTQKTINEWNKLSTLSILLFLFKFQILVLRKYII